jgi:hypothetical protein
MDWEIKQLAEMVELFKSSLRFDAQVRVGREWYPLLHFTPFIFKGRIFYDVTYSANHVTVMGSHFPPKTRVRVKFQEVIDG